MKKIKRLFFLIIIGVFIFSGLQIKIGYDKYLQAITENPLENVIGELMNKDNYTKYEDIPDIYFDALIAVEDRRFYKHKGFDIIGTGRAIYNDLRALELLEGGSTISQQLAKNLYFPLDDTIHRKIAEIFMAMKMEKVYDKEEILEFYVNAIYYGSGYYSIYDAAVGYFNKTPEKMTDYECTLLVGIPNAPSVYSLDVNVDLAHKRQEKVLECMVELEYISQDEYNNILTDK